MVLLGAHVGVSGGYREAVDYAVSVGCECMQVFAKSPRQWSARPISEVVASGFRSRRGETGMGPVLVHTAYLINLGSADDALWERSWMALADELSRGQLLGADAVVTHLGTTYRDAPEHTAARIACALDRAWAASAVRSTRLLLENTAAAGTTFGDGPDELGAVLRLLDGAAGHVGVCLDTCHAHAAGWDLSRSVTWTDLVDAFEECCGMPIEAVHANDCAFGPGLHKDRHAWIGDGTIGLDGFAAMFAESRLAGLPVITEMPGEVPVKDVENIARLRQLRDACGERASSA
ncbi:MAG: deoxyribonuclease IV [Coriobacteriia bacterium]|nr:deoxyribonuclease IV [Coriobacteriia bacterium]